MAGIVNLDERYTFEKQAGQGTYGITWVAVEKETGKRVIIKGISKTNTSRSDFKRELHYSRSLSKHPNIITTHSTAYETKTSYVTVQDYATGGDLFSVIEPEVGLKESTAKEYLGQICRAVEYMHGKNLVHRDIKPENIVLADEERSIVQLIDFGMTMKIGKHLTKVRGSIPYTAPEICSSSNNGGFYVDPSGDVWAVGILLFGMLTGRFPWEQATFCDQNYYEFVQWQCGAVSNPPPAWQSFSPELLSLFNRMLTIRPEPRIPIADVCQYIDYPWFNVYSDTSFDTSFDDSFESTPSPNQFTTI